MYPRTARGYLPSVLFRNRVKPLRLLTINTKGIRRSLDPRITLDEIPLSYDQGCLWLSP